MEIIEESKNLAKEMYEKYRLPPFESTEFIAKKGVELAAKLGADARIVAVGCYLMDIALGKAYSDGRIKEHVRMGSEIAKEFLGKFDLSEEERGKIINCIEAHHGAIEHNCIESEIAKNADNMRFLEPTGLLISLYHSHEIDRSVEEWMSVAKNKVEEKHKLVTLDICKEELYEKYKLICNFLDAATDL